jgi:hypothetical protein
MPKYSVETLLALVFIFEVLTERLPKQIFFLLVFVVSLFHLASAADGQLVFDQSEQSFEVKPEQGSVTAIYRFTNAGKDPVAIVNVQTSCGCTTAGLKKSEYAPGEAGEIEAKFSFGGRTGKQEKTILVQTSQAEGKPIVLRLMVDIKDEINIQPALILWRVGDQPDPKKIQITVADGASAKVLSVFSDNPAIKTQLSEVKPGKEYEIEVTPTNLARPDGATILIRTDSPARNPRILYAYVRIK